MQIEIQLQDLQMLDEPFHRSLEGPFLSSLHLGVALEAAIIPVVIITEHMKVNADHAPCRRAR